jgi:hypothetical protein
VVEVNLSWLQLLAERPSLNQSGRAVQLEKAQQKPQQQQLLRQSCAHHLQRWVFCAQNDPRNLQTQGSGTQACGAGARKYNRRKRLLKARKRHELWTSSYVINN